MTITNTTDLDLKSAHKALQTSIQKWGKKFTRETNSEMVELITNIHELEGKDYSGVKVEKGIKYGEDERQRLDVYYPKDATTESRLPVVVFFHGGGMVVGDTDVTPTFHSNIGNYLAINSILLISCTYRLLPTAAHPSGAIDISLALSWAINHSSTYFGSPSTSLTIIGHSAGGSCTGTALWGGFLTPDVMPETVLANSTFLFWSAGLWYDVENEPTSVNMPRYHRTDDKERIRAEMPVSVFRGWVEGLKKELGGDGVGERGERRWNGPKMKFFLGEWEFDEIVKGTEGCEAVWEEVFVGEGEDGEEAEGDDEEFGELDVEMVWGENHVSYVYGIGTEGSWIGERLLEIVKGGEKS